MVNMQKMPKLYPSREIILLPVLEVDDKPEIVSQTCESDVFYDKIVCMS